MQIARMLSKILLSYQISAGCAQAPNSVGLHGVTLQVLPRSIPVQVRVVIILL